MPLSFTGLDWLIVAAYIGALALAGWWASRRRMADADSFFLADHHVPIWLVTISVLSTTQSAATFLGAPDNAYRGDYTYLTANLAALIAAVLVAKLLIPRFYAAGVTTVYQLLEQRISLTAGRAAAAMYLVGRTLASGARLYLAAIAVSMVIFLDVDAPHILLAIGLLALLGIAFTLFGGLNAVIWSDLVQVILYVGAAMLVFALLLWRIPAPAGAIWDALAHAPDGTNKLRLIETSLDWSKPFTIWAILSGLVLLNVGNAGLDQDTTQRFLACRDSRHAERALYVSAIATIPVVALFLGIGSLLHIFYERPDLMGAGASAANAFAGEKITVFMAFILSEVPPGLRGLVAVGIIAAAAINSGLISMSAVAISDFYRPWRERRRPVAEQHFVTAGRCAMVALAMLLSLTAAFCYVWQRATDLPLLEFVLAVMTFAYSGLIGVYAAAIFTRRGSTASVIAALLTGFAVTLLLQPPIASALRLPAPWNALAFPWQLCLGSAAAFMVAIAGRQPSGLQSGAIVD